MPTPKKRESKQQKLSNKKPVYFSPATPKTLQKKLHQIFGIIPS